MADCLRMWWQGTYSQGPSRPVWMLVEFWTEEAVLRNQEELGLESPGTAAALWIP